MKGINKIIVFCYVHKTGESHYLMLNSVFAYVININDLTEFKEEVNNLRNTSMKEGS